MPDAFHYRDNILYCEDVELSRLAAHAGTPCYVYSAAALRANFLGYERALEGVPHTRLLRRQSQRQSLPCCALLAESGAGFDIVSGGELFRVLKAGGDPSLRRFLRRRQDRARRSSTRSRTASTASIASPSRSWR